MAVHKHPRAHSVDLLGNDGVFIVFEDGKCAVYSHDLLYETFDRAKEVEEDFEDSAIRKETE